MSNSQISKQDLKKDGKGHLFSFKAIRGLALPIIVVALFLVTRLPNLGRFVTADEAYWLRLSANFYTAVRQGDWEATFESAHPGVTTMGAGAIAIQIVFPEYGELVDGAISDFHLRHLLWENGINPIELLAVGRAVAVLINGLAFAALWPFARKILGKWGAFGGMALLAMDPNLIGLQRLLHQDGILSSFMMLALFAYLVYLKKGQMSVLLLSGLAMGLAGLTKSPGWFLLPFVFLASFWMAWKSKNDGKLAARKLIVAPFIWTATAWLTIFILFPAMWVKPMLLIGSMMQYALASAEGFLSGPIFFAGQIFPKADLGARSIIFYPLMALWRSTPLSLLGLILCGAFVWWTPEESERDERAKLGLLLLFAVMFTVLISLGTKKFDRYNLPAMTTFLMMAGWGLARASQTIRDIGKNKWLRSVLALALVLGLGFQFWGVINSAPYFISYYNPLMGGPRAAIKSVQMGWGEGMEQAAKFLLTEPGIADKKVAAWYSTSFNILFEYDASHIPIAANLPADDLASMLENDYLVIYLHQWQRGTPSNLLAAIDEADLVFRYEVEGLDYVRVYRPQSQ